jgi:hypothetical protein
MFHGKRTDTEVVAIIEALRTRGWVTVDGAKVTYALPSEA